MNCHYDCIYLYLSIIVIKTSMRKIILLIVAAACIPASLYCATKAITTNSEGVPATSIIEITGEAAPAAIKPSETITPASDSRITWVGRVLSDEEGVSFDWSATYARISFEGKYLAIKVSDTKKNYYNVWIDKVPVLEADKVVATEGEDSIVVLADESDFAAIYGKKVPARHTVTIQKRTEGEQGRTTVKEFITRGALLQAEPLKERMIEFVGDSYTCGYGSENSVGTDPFKPETENSGKTYAAAVARYFGADYITIAHSGMGIARNYNTKFTGWYMPQRYMQTFDEDQEVKWEGFKDGFKPAMTIIYLGTNDFSVSLQPSYSAFKRNYIALIKEIKEYWGEDHPVLCVSSMADELLFDYVRDVVDDCGMENVHYFGFFPQVHNDSTELGASFHPSWPAHNKLAYSILPYISTLTGWPLQTF